MYRKIPIAIGKNNVILLFILGFFILYMCLMFSNWCRLNSQLDLRESIDGNVSFHFIPDPAVS